MSKSCKLFSLSFYFIVMVFSFTSCSNSHSIEVNLNPHKTSPLSAIFKIKYKEPCRVTYKVIGETPITQFFELVSDSLDVPVLGLYPGVVNKVVVSLRNDNIEIVDTIEVKTEPLPVSFPIIQINKINRSKMEAGLHGCDMHYANRGRFSSIPMIFDDQGKVRWYLDLSSKGRMTGPFQRLKDGNLLMVDRHTIFEYDMLGKSIKETQISANYGMHHDVLELPDGNLLICVGKRDAFVTMDGKKLKSDSDFIIHFDRKTSKVTKEWDLAKHLDVSRKDLSLFRKGDWLHMNGLAFDESDNSIIMSGKNQGIVSITWEDKLKWILAPKKNWGKSGRNEDGYDIKPYLLTAIDSNDNQYKDEIQMGLESADNFDFAYGQHAPAIHPNGNLLVFDNGIYRNFDKTKTFSRAVEYKINDEDRTVKQVWQYGKERDRNFFSIIVSDVDVLPNTENILVTSGFINPRTNHSGKIVEVDYKTGEEIFEATLYYKTLNGNKTANWGQSDILYRSERMELTY